MPVGIDRLKKTTSKEDPFEKLISIGLFEEAGEILFAKGLRKFGAVVQSLSDTLPYLPASVEESIKIKIVRAYRKVDIGASASKADTMAFSTLEGAMKFLQLKKTEVEDTTEKIRELELDTERRKKEENLLVPTIPFTTLSHPKRIGVTSADIIVIGHRQRLTDALRDFDYRVEGFARGQVIIRGVDLLAIASDSFYTKHKKGDPIFKKKPKKGSWKEEFEKKHKKPKFTDSDLALIVSRNKKLKKFRIVSKQYIRHKGFIYMLLLPPTVITPPYCEQKRGKIHPILTSWGILGIDNE